jgi:hypothetical protein
MQPSADGATRFGDRLSAQDPLARFDQRHRGRARVLIERQDELLDRARGAQRLCSRALLVSIEPQSAAHSGLSHGQADAGRITMQSTGQGGMHNSQPVHCAAMTVCMKRDAPTMASTGHA